LAHVKNSRKHRDPLAAQAQGRKAGRGRSGRFLVTCAAGFEDVVARALPTDVAHLEVIEVDSGMLLLEGNQSGSATGRLAKLDYLSGVHQIVDEVSLRSPKLEHAVEAFVQNLRSGRAPAPAAKRGSFRLRVIKEGQPVKFDVRSRQALEQAVQRWGGMRPEARGGGAEVWVYVRRDDPRVWLTLRLDRAERRRTAAGALKLEVAAALVRVAPLNADDRFLDVFAGSGAVAAARSRVAHRGIVAVDVDPQRCADLRARLARNELGPAAEVHCADVRDLVPAVVAAGSVDVAVLDPPWGSFDTTLSSGDLADIYDASIRMLDLALAPTGHAVLLVADAQLLQLVKRTPTLASISSTPALVNGKKVSVVHLGRP
jgi:23S rRNA G2445 N2-methylase RlmL